MIDLSKYHNQKCRATLIGQPGTHTGTVVLNGADSKYYFVSHLVFVTGEAIERIELVSLGRPRLPESERRTPRTAHLTNANWSILEERYGNVTKALEALLERTPTASVGDVFQVQADGKLLKL